MSRDRDRARVALEFLGEWFEKGIEPHIVAFGLLSIDPTLLPIRDTSQVDEFVKGALSGARPGPITSPEGGAWLRRVAEEAIETLADFAIVDGVQDIDPQDLPQGPLTVEEFRASSERYAKRRMDHYDCLDVPMEAGTVRLFGPANIGILELTSMQVGGQLASDQTSLIDHWYARTDARGHEREELERWAEGANAILNVGDHPVWIRPLSVLLRGHPWIPPSRRDEVATPEEMEQFRAARDEGAEPVIVPVRQHMSITVGLPVAPSPVKARIWVHVEGLTLREIQ